MPARERLSAGFRQALEVLGQGFLSNAANKELRAALRQGTLTKDGYFEELLRLVYRLVFVLTAEERDLLHAKDASDSAAPPCMQKATPCAAYVIEPCDAAPTTATGTCGRW